MTRDELLEKCLTKVGTRKGFIDKNEASGEYALGFADGWHEADKHPCAKIWHRKAELKDFRGVVAYFFCQDNKVREVSYTGDLHFEFMGIPFDNDFMLFWCDRQDLLRMTNLKDLL